MVTKPIFQTVLACAILLALVAPTQAAPLTIFNTGLDVPGTAALPDNGLDTHYLLLPGSPTSGVPFAADTLNGFPIAPAGPWLADSPSTGSICDTPISRWIAPTLTTVDAVGIYTYRTTFNLTGFVASTATLSGCWSTDNNGVDILKNLLPTGNTTPFGGFGAWTPFTIAGPFNAGLNDLDFVVFNGGGPTGLRVVFIEAQADLIDVNLVPEPSSLALLGIGLAGLGALRRRKG